MLMLAESSVFGVDVGFVAVCPGVCAGLVVTMTAVYCAVVVAFGLGMGSMLMVDFALILR